MSDINNNEILSKEEVENRRKEIMREHLIDIFEKDSILFDIYKSRNWLDRLFTDPILLMDTQTSYTSTQLAAICEVPVHLINNRRRELMDYLKPEVYGEENNKTFKHNYISAFKMKMVIGLTGEGGEYSVPNLKELLFSGKKVGYSKNQNSNSETSISNDQLYQMLNMMKRFEKFQDMIDSNEFFDEIERKVISTTEKMLSSSKDDTGINESKKLFDFICSGNGSLIEKEQTLNDFDNLISRYPDQQHMILMYRSASEDRITRIRQDERELNIKKLKIKIADLVESYNNAQNDDERNNIKSRISVLTDDHPDLKFEIRMWMATIPKQSPKKGLFSRIFSK